MSKILIETDIKYKDRLETLKNEIGNDARFVESKSLDGSSLVQLLIDKAPAYITLIITVIKFMKEHNEANKIKKDDGSRITNADPAQAAEFINKETKDDQPKENS
jgi:hypothetical protein